MNKKLLFMFLLLFACQIICAQETFVGNLKYSYDANAGTATIIGDESYQILNEVEIPAVVTIKGKDYKVTAIDNGAFQSCLFINSLILPEGIESIGDYAFVDMINLQTLVLPSTLKNIGAEVIVYDNNLYTVVSHVSDPFVINEKAFISYGNWNEETQSFEIIPSLATLYVPNGKTALYEKAGWSKQFVTVEEGEFKEAKVGDLKYTYSTDNDEATVVRDDSYFSLEKIDIPATITIEGKVYKVTAIGNKAFDNCIHVESLTIPEGIKSIGNRAFYSMIKLRRLELPSSLRTIGQLIISQDEDLSVIVSNATDPVLVSDNTFIFQERWSQVTQSIECPELSHATLYVPVGKSAQYAEAGWSKQFDKVEEEEPKQATVGVYKYAYRTNGTEATVIRDDSYKNLKNVDIPATITIDGKKYSVTAIGNHAFKSYTNIESVTLPEGIKSIGNYSFYELRPDYYTLLGGIREIVLPSTLKSIGAYAFSMCHGLKTITVPEGVESIGDYAFKNMGLGTIGLILRRLELPSTLKSIGYGVISESGGVTAVVSRIVDPFIISDKTFILFDDGTKTDATLYVPIGQSAKYAEAGWSRQFAMVEEGEQKDVKIGSYVYTYSTGGTEATVIQDDSYQYLTAVNIPATINIEEKTYKVTSVSNHAFENCAGITSVTLPEGMTSIDASSFADCISITSVSLPEGLVSIGNGAFGNCDNIQEIVLPSTLKSIGLSAFNDCERLNNIAIPEGVETIGNQAFYYSGLTRLELPMSLKEIGVSLIAYCENLTSVVSYNIDPFAVSNLTFSTYPLGAVNLEPEDITPPSAILYVPSGTADAYRNAPGWNMFENIVEMHSDVPGDANNDEKIDKRDVKAVERNIIEGENRGFNAKNAHGGEVGKVTVADIVRILNMIREAKQ